MDKTTYILRVNGVVLSTHRSEAAARKATVKHLGRAEVSVEMHVISGTYKSTTQVWPTLGITYASN